MSCISCGGETNELFSLGHQYLSDFFPSNIRVDSAKHWLNVRRCENCTLVQLDRHVPQDQLYHERYSFKSGVSPAIRADLQDVVEHALEYVEHPEIWLDIASNDGTLLSFVPSERRIGIDPLEQFALEACQYGTIIKDFFDVKYFSDIKFDVITSVSMFYDIPDPTKFVQDVKSILKDDGVWLIQQNYVSLMLENNSIDNISHEHLAYYDLTSMKNLLDRAGLEINEVTLNPINGGCFRLVVSHPGKYPVDHNRIWDLLTDETALDDNYWKTWYQKINKQVINLGKYIKHLHSAGNKIYVYGASTRGGTIWQLAGIDNKYIDKVVDRNPDKVSKYMSSIGVEIISEEEMRKNQPDYLLVGPWWFADQFIIREQEYLNNGGKMIIPLPTMRIISAEQQQPQ